MNTEVRIIEHQSTRAPGHQRGRIQDARLKMQDAGVKDKHRYIEG